MILLMISIYLQIKFDLKKFVKRKMYQIVKNLKLLKNVKFVIKIIILMIINNVYLIHDQE